MNIKNFDYETWLLGIDMEHTIGSYMHDCSIAADHPAT